MNQHFMFFEFPLVSEFFVANLAINRFMIGNGMIFHSTGSSKSFGAMLTIKNFFSMNIFHMVFQIVFSVEWSITLWTMISLSQFTSMNVSVGNKKKKPLLIWVIFDQLNQSYFFRAYLYPNPHFSHRFGLSVIPCILSKWFFKARSEKKLLNQSCLQVNKLFKKKTREINYHTNLI